MNIFTSEHNLLVLRESVKDKTLTCFTRPAVQFKR